MSDYELLVQKRILMPPLPSMTYKEVTALSEWAQKAFAAIRENEREQAAQRASEADMSCCGCPIDLEVVIAAVRGECNEECEHDWWQVWSYLPVTCRLCGAARGEDAQ